MRCCRDGQRNFHRLAVGVGSSGVGGDILVIDIYRTLDIPVVGRYGATGSHRSFILAADVVAVVDNHLCAVHEVTAGLPFVLACIIGCVNKILLGDSTCVQVGDGGVRLAGWTTFTMFVLGIDEAATDTRLHINQVEFDNTRDIAPVFLIDIGAGALLGGQLQIDTRGQCHLIMTITIITSAIGLMSLFPLFISSCAIRISTTWGDSRRLVLCLVCVVGDTLCCMEIHITGQCTKIVHDIIDTKVVTMVISCRNVLIEEFLIQRHLTYTVDGIIRVVSNLRHTVLSTLHHHTTAEHTTEVSTLNGIHRTASIDWQHTILLPICR